MLMEKPTESVLRKLYLEDLRSVASIAKEYGVGERTATIWLGTLNIPIRTKLEQQRIYLDARWEKKHKIVNDEVADSEAINIPVQVTDGVLVPGELVRQQPTPISVTEPPPDTAYGRLNRNQQLAIELLSQFDESMTFQQVADDVGVNLPTLAVWRKQSDFQIALDEAQKPNFISELKGLSRRDLLDRFKTGVGLTREDRVVAFKLTNDLGSDSTVSVNTQVNFSNGW